MTGRDLFCLVAATAVAWLFHLYVRLLPTALVVACWVLLTGAITAGLFQRARLRRRALLSVYVAAGSPWQMRLRGGVLMGVGALALAGLLAMVLALGLARLEPPAAWLALAAAMPVLVGLRRILHRRLASHVAATYLPLLSWRAAALATGLVLLGVLVALAARQVYPDFSGVSLERAAWHMVDQQHARSALAQALLQGMAAFDGLRLWLAQQLMPTPGTSVLQLLGWLLVFAEGLLFVWSYLLMAYGVLTMVGTHDRGER
ncbi:hypothetical protein [Wenzhouxiangella sp. XN24]|uniref:hypothetical protein n=1 Tax=Wenzhouxiangella sp. XN24 TaxID=2713569 RepID=UPI0013EDC603|nr:hypothetical protein [Wenzhouxiangella sp. XN24]NGX16165.1 hypothetical protein [Wenzhouxiangella sp. XN24]